MTRNEYEIAKKFENYVEQMIVHIGWLGYAFGTYKYNVSKFSAGVYAIEYLTNLKISELKSKQNGDIISYFYGNLIFKFNKVNKNELAEYCDYENLENFGYWNVYDNTDDKEKFVNYIDDNLSMEKLLKKGTIDNYTEAEFFAENSNAIEIDTRYEYAENEHVTFSVEAYIDDDCEKNDYDYEDEEDEYYDEDYYKYVAKLDYILGDIAITDEVAIPYPQDLRYYIDNDNNDYVGGTFEDFSDENCLSYISDCDHLGDSKTTFEDMKSTIQQYFEHCKRIDEQTDK